jgi:hypothetical protein
LLIYLYNILWQVACQRCGSCVLSVWRAEGSQSSKGVRALSGGVADPSLMSSGRYTKGV